ncbi:hypothetical protein HDF16_005291 [Granulicella aggregans]|uniref:TIGR01777 family protein n=1 Tax=Granulicella aggregans TaxID=474949 RepID=A0A7W7ZIH1_9BACT|nr:TIGR01777 family oxidoreductase [Granulicella aggregans]MBB5060555.1 hypothetical protein [Granulicella aggregans]
MTLNSPLSKHKQQSARRILISGTSGLIGRAVVASRQRAGDVVVSLVRGKGTADALLWSPGSGKLDPALVSGFDTVIHLAGEPVVGLWSSAKKRRIMESRVLGTAELAAALASAALPPRLFLSASGINFYGNRGDTVLDETSFSGQGFLAEVCRAWEAASQPLIKRSRIVHLRIGVVLASEGGMLPRLLPAFRMGLGAIVGDGEGYVSWIALEDLVRVIDYLVDASDIDGPVNVVAPQPVTSEALNRAIGRAVDSKVRLRLPAWPFRLLLGQLAEETIFGSVRAIPARLIRDGFLFHRESLDEALTGMHLREP